MPVIELNANTSIPNKKEVALKLTKLVASLLGKPESVRSSVSDRVVLEAKWIVDDCIY